MRSRNKKGFWRIQDTIKRFSLDKRQKYVLAVIVLSLALFFSERRLDIFAILFSVIIAILTNVFMFWSNYKELKENPSFSFFILPFFYSLSFSLFYFLIPSRLITRGGITAFYAIGLYSLFLSQNIFTVASIRTIALLSSARIVSFILTLVSYFFLSNIILSLDLNLFPTGILLFLSSFFLIYHCVWTYTLQKLSSFQILWVGFVSLCLFELSLILWFWPSNSTIIALFLTGFLYTLVGLSHVWLDKRLFRGVLWEYIWVAVIVFCVLIVSTSWKG